ncbi:phosphopantetheine-binding protein [Streptomyces sp. NPDC028722]|uniref:acyl carrier protein n=1 Tax=unclassified Streptomyces TaxID=2593676 RepID=UPI0033FE3D88
MRRFTVADFQKSVDACVGTDERVVFDDSAMDVTFAELGLDSLAVYEMFTRLEADLGLEIPDDDLDGLTTAGAVLTYVRHRLTGERH